MLGFLVAATTGVLAGLAAGLSKRISEFLGPLVTAMNAISGIAWIPLAIAWFGIGTGMAVFIVWNAAFFLIFGNTVLGVRLVPQVLESSLLTLGASRARSCARSFSLGPCRTSCPGFDRGLASAGEP